jgi:hypothetical protein
VSLDRAVDHRFADNLADYPTASKCGYSVVVESADAGVGAEAGAALEAGPGAPPGGLIACAAHVSPEDAVIAGVGLYQYPP